MAVFKAEEVPRDCPLYIHPAPTESAELVALRARVAELVESLSEMYLSVLDGDFYEDHDEAWARIGRAKAALDGRIAEPKSKSRLESQLQRASKVLPKGWRIMVEVEHEGSGVTLIDSLGNYIDFPSNYESLSDNIGDAISEALAQQVTKHE